METMGSGRPKNPTLAGILSGLMPGLGQFYCRQWAKGAGFLVGAIAVDAAFGISSGTLTVLQSVGGPPPSEGLGRLLLGMLVLLGLAVWSIVDAVKTAKHRSA